MGGGGGSDANLDCKEVGARETIKTLDFLHRCVVLDSETLKVVRRLNVVPDRPVGPRRSTRGRFPHSFGLGQDLCVGVWCQFDTTLLNLGGLDQRSLHNERHGVPESMGAAWSVQIQVVGVPVEIAAVEWARFV